MRFSGGGPGGAKSAPHLPVLLILLEIYQLISTFSIHESYHSIQKQITHGGGDGLEQEPAHPPRPTLPLIKQVQ